VKEIDNLCNYLTRAVFHAHLGVDFAPSHGRISTCPLHNAWPRAREITQTAATTIPPKNDFVNFNSAPSSQGREPLRLHPASISPCQQPDPQAVVGQARASRPSTLTAKLRARAPISSLILDFSPTQSKIVRVFSLDPLRARAQDGAARSA
jgi:hypothetical protein